MDSGRYTTLDDGNPVEEEEETVPLTPDKEFYSWDWRGERVLMRLTQSVDDEMASISSVSRVHDNPASEHEVVICRVLS